MTLRVTIDKLPAGGGPAETLGVVEIHNTGRTAEHGPHEYTFYDVLLAADEHHSAARVGGVWHCRSKEWWRLVMLAFCLRGRR